MKPEEAVAENMAKGKAKPVNKMACPLKPWQKRELLRMEARLNKRSKIKQLFTKLGITSDLTMKELFKRTNAKKVLSYYLDELESKRPQLLDFNAASDDALLATLIFNNPTLTPNKIMQMYGLKKALELVNIRELKNMFSKHSSNSWQRLMADVKKLQLPQTESPFDEIRKQIEIFKAVKWSKI